MLDWLYANKQVDESKDLFNLWKSLDGIGNGILNK